jgi:L,D-peptidoglycan transpeptidase YkuD (ErfK/YbiS/YcfS/YnhG family)
MAVLSVHAAGWADLAGTRYRCALGPAGVIAAKDKREGDGATPAGLWPLRRVLFRADRGPPPATRLPCAAIAPNDGWCDAPSDPNYNRQVALPYPASAERLWRADSLYDLILVIGHNDAPVAPGAGSAVFVHLARADFSPTQGCVALERPVLEALLAIAVPGDAVEVLADGVAA